MILMFALGVLVGVLLCRWHRALARRRRAKARVRALLVDQSQGTSETSRADTSQ